MEVKHYNTLEEYYKVHLRHEAEEIKGEEVKEPKKAKKNENKTKTK